MLGDRTRARSGLLASAGAPRDAAGAMSSPTRAPLRSVTTVVVGVVLLAGCGDGPSTAELQERLDAQAAAHQTSQQRIDELEDRLAAVATDDGTAALEEELTGRIDDLTVRIDDLARQVDEAATAREDERAETLAALSSLEAAVGDLRAELDRLDTALTRLREDHELLSRRVDTHRH